MTTHLIVNKVYLADHRETMRKLIGALVEVTGQINSNQTKTTLVLNGQLKKETGKALKDEVIQKAMARVAFTWDPICASLKQSAEASQRIGFIRKAPALDGIYSLDLLNDVLKEKNLPLVEGAGTIKVMRATDPNSQDAAVAARPVKLKLTNVSKTYLNGTQPVAALQPVSIEIRDGEFVIFFGPSGCGKSSLLNIIAGFEDVTEGEITLDGVPVEGPHHDRLMLFQEHGLFPWLNVIENVMYGLKHQFRFKPKARREHARQFLQMVDLGEFEKAAIHELSGGMKQRVALARALAPDPKVLLVDEPFPALDALTRAKLYGDIQEIHQRTRKTIILVTHDAHEAACLGDRVIVFSGRRGWVKADITIDLVRPRDINNPAVAECAAGIMTQLEASDK